MRAICVDLNFNLDKSDGEAEALQRQARRRWRACAHLVRAGGGRAATGKAHVKGAGAGGKEQVEGAVRGKAQVEWAVGGGKTHVEVAAVGAWLRQGAGGGALMD